MKEKQLFNTRKNLIIGLYLVLIFIVLSFTSVSADQSPPAIAQPGFADFEPLNNTSNGATLCWTRGNAVQPPYDYFGYIGSNTDEDWYYYYVIASNQSHQVYTHVPYNAGVNVGVDYYDADMNYLTGTTGLGSDPLNTTFIVNVNLAPGFYYRKVYNNGGNTPVTYYSGRYTSPPLDIQAPTVPQNLIPTYIGSDRIDLTWDSSIDDGTVPIYFGYLIANMDTSSLVGGTNYTSYSITGLTPGSTYNFAVGAYDTAGNTSNFTDSLTVETFTSHTTNPGSNVTISPGNDVEIEIESVSNAGTTTVTASDTPPPEGIPSGIHIGGCWLYWDISTTATIGGSIEITLPYDPSLSDEIAETLVMYHWNGSQWEAVATTADTLNHTVTGTVTSLSPFILGYSSLPGVGSSGANTNVLIAIALLAISTGIFLLRRLSTKSNI
jgi:hypothetical protein